MARRGQYLDIFILQRREEEGHRARWAAPCPLELE